MHVFLRENKYLTEKRALAGQLETGRRVGFYKIQDFQDFIK